MRAEDFDYTRLLVANLCGEAGYAREQQAIFKAAGGGLDPDGGFLIPDELSVMFIDEARNASVAVQAGATTKTMNTRQLDIARQTSGVTVTSKSENATIDFIDEAYGMSTLQSFTIMGGTKVSRELLEDASNARQIISAGMAADVATKFDGYAFIGTGAGEPTGLTNDVDVNTQDVSTSIEVDEIITSVGSIADANGPVDGLSIAYNSDLWEAVEQLKDGNGAYLGLAGGPPAMNNLKRFVTNAIPTATNATEAFVGHFPSLALGLPVVIDSSGHRRGRRTWSKSNLDNCIAQGRLVSIKAGLVHCHGIYHRLKEAS